jgi:anti-sigma regulatory factor (Ser/Thr protein kinase)
MPDIPLVPSLWRFPAHPSSVRRARHAVAEALPYALRPHLAADLCLLTSELVSNSIRHGARPEGDDLVELVLWPADGHYWLAVSDPGTGIGGRMPVVRCPDADCETGRGLLLVDHLATAWAVRRRGDRGTSVIAGMPLHRGG